MGRNNRVITFIIHNFGWMVVSFALAMLIWVAANLERNPVEQDQLAGVPVHIDVPEGFVVTVRPDIPTVTAVIRAAASEWNLLVPSDVLVTADAIVLRKRPARPSDRLRGLAAGRGWYDPDPDTYLQELRDEWEERGRERAARTDPGHGGGTPADRAGQQRPDLPHRRRRGAG